jgi:hypothetical protein
VGREGDCRRSREQLLSSAPKCRLVDTRMTLPSRNRRGRHGAGAAAVNLNDVVLEYRKPRSFSHSGPSMTWSYPASASTRDVVKPEGRDRLNRISIDNAVPEPRAPSCYDPACLPLHQRCYGIQENQMSAIITLTSAKPSLRAKGKTGHCAWCCALLWLTRIAATARPPTLVCRPSSRALHLQVPLPTIRALLACPFLSVSMSGDPPCPCRHRG